MNAALRELIEAADLNALLRAVDGLCTRRSWDELIDLAEACEDAVERGKQLWPIAAHIDYRVALEGPGEVLAEVLRPDVGRFAAGPLTEVAASTHPWEELAPYVETPLIAAYLAQERVQRGEILDGDERAHQEVLELPLHIEEWEPTYALAKFLPFDVEVAEPWEPTAPLVAVDPDGRIDLLDESEITTGLLDLVTPWTNESNGAASAAVVEGDAVQACTHLGGPLLRVGRLEPAEALQRMAWAAASGGAHGRRRGAALGRFMAWYMTALLTDCAWPCEPAELGRRAQELKWYRWDEGETEKGWVLRLAIEDPRNGWAAALAATDVLQEEQ